MQTDAQKRAIKKYREKTYAVYTVHLRKQDDADLIADIDRAKASGISYRDYLRDLYQKAKKDL